MEKRVFFDVGANNGHHSIPVAYSDSNTIVYAFEPTPKLISVIEEKTQNLENYNLIKKAVSNYNGKSSFNVAGQHDWGCSSLLEFSDKSKTNWPGRTDFVITSVIDVDVIRLDSFIENKNIKVIDYLHIDTQGSDLNVLKGLGKYTSIVKEGIMEAGTSENILYYNKNTKDECIEFLEKNGFEIKDVHYCDHYGNEVNIVFQNKNLM